MEVVAQCFEEMAAGLNRHGALMLTDSQSHHCWFFPPPDARGTDTPPPADDSPDDCTCSCGKMLLSDVPPDSSWSSIGREPLGDPTVPRPLPSYWQHHSSTGVFDLLTPRVAALSCANGLSDIVLNTAFVLTQHQ